MKVYVATRHYYEDHIVLGVYASQDIAVAMLDHLRHKSKQWGYNHGEGFFGTETHNGHFIAIEEFELVDKESEEPAQGTPTEEV